MGEPEDERPGDDHSADPEREAILRRRNRWIALALSGASLAASGCGPTACLDIAVEPDGGPDAGPDGGEADGG